MNYCVYTPDGHILKTGFAPKEMHQAIIDAEKLVIFHNDMLVRDHTHYVDVSQKKILPYTERELQAQANMPYGWTWCMPAREARDLRDPDQRTKDALTVCLKSRAAAYPALKDFADAMYWHSRGDPSKLEAYFLACDNVKKQFPKPNVD